MLQDVIARLRDILIRKGRSVGGESKFALLNVGQAKAAAAEYIPVAIILDEEGDDPSHSMVTGYEAYNDQVAEALAKVILATFAAQTASKFPLRWWIINSTFSGEGRLGKGL
jgi:hypothetical protein